MIVRRMCPSRQSVLSSRASLHLGIRPPAPLPVNGFHDYGSLYPTLPVDTNDSLYKGLLGV